MDKIHDNVYRKCTIENCYEKYHAKGYCKKHYNKMNYKKYYINNKEYHLNRQKQYYENNKDKCSEYHKKYYELNYNKNKDEINLKNKERYKEKHIKAIKNREIDRINKFNLIQKYRNEGKTFIEIGEIMKISQPSVSKFYKKYLEKFNN